VNAGGFILGDEASGGVLGRKLVSDYIKGVLPKDLQAAFTEQYHLDYAQIVDKVYKQPVPSRFLASFSHFIEDHMDSPHIDHLLRSSFKEFFTRNVYQYDYKNYKVNFVGSIAFVFKKILEQVAEECGVEIGIIMRSPIEGLIHYHQIDVKGGR
jgi:N-acetylglucosamine kinase-like BadF-type ATPase